MSHAFDLVVVGAGGGPDETDLSAYLLKPAHTAWDDGIVALEAGSGPGALRRLLNQNPGLFSGKIYTAGTIYSLIHSCLLTHAHLDHINSLVISAGSTSGTRKRIYAAEQTLQDLQTIFSGRIWPDLASWDEQDDPHKLLYTPLPFNGEYHRIFPEVSVKAFSLSHGHNGSESYSSSAFLIRHDQSFQEFLFFGDVEPDSLASTPLNSAIWREVARKIPDVLSTIFIECSWPSDRTDDHLYGHLNPQHLADEVTALATEVVSFRRSESKDNDDTEDDDHSPPSRKRQKMNPIIPEELQGSLKGLRIFIIHCKDDMDKPSDAPPIRQVILEQVRAVLEPKALGLEVLSAEPGMHITI